MTKYRGCMKIKLFKSSLKDHILTPCFSLDAMNQIIKRKKVSKMRTEKEKMNSLLVKGSISHTCYFNEILPAVFFSYFMLF